MGPFGQFMLMLKTVIIDSPQHTLACVSTRKQNQTISWIFFLNICTNIFQETDRLLGQQYSDDTGYYDTVKVKLLFKYYIIFFSLNILAKVYLINI